MPSWHETVIPLTRTGVCSDTTWWRTRTAVIGMKLWILQARATGSSTPRACSVSYDATDLDEYRGVAEAFDFVSVSLGRPVCLLTVATSEGSRVFVVPAHLEASAAALTHSKSRTVVRCRGRTPTPVIAALAEAPEVAQFDAEDDDAV